MKKNPHLRRQAINRRKKVANQHRIPNYLAVAREGGMSSTNIPHINELNLEREKIDENSALGLSAVDAAAAEAEEDMDLPSEGEESDLRYVLPSQ